MSRQMQTAVSGTPKQVYACQTKRLRLRHVRAIFRLLFEIRDLGISPLAWRRHMLRHLLPFVGASTGIAVEVIVPKRIANPRLLGTVIGGVTDPRLLGVYRALIERGGYALDLRRQGLAEQANTTILRRRQQMAEARAWEQRPDIDPWRMLDCEYFICSNQYLPSSGCLHLIILTRSAREGPFSEFERRLIAVFHAELGRLWRQTDGEAVDNLPSCLQKTLELLLEGSSEKQIVARLGISPHTVHDHVKRLYRRFQVNSRAQLLANLSHSPQIRAPRLCVNLLKGSDDHRFDGVETTQGKSGPPASIGSSNDRANRLAQAVAVRY